VVSEWYAIFGVLQNKPVGSATKVTICFNQLNLCFLIDSSNCTINLYANLSVCFGEKLATLTCTSRAKNQYFRNISYIFRHSENLKETFRDSQKRTKMWNKTRLINHFYFFEVCKCVYTDCKHSQLALLHKP